MIRKRQCEYCLSNGINTIVPDTGMQDKILKHYGMDLCSSCTKQTGQLLEIFVLRNQLGDGGFLAAEYVSGDVLLWNSETDSEEDDGKNAIARWKLNSSEISVLGCVDRWL